MKLYRPALLAAAICLCGVQSTHAESRQFSTFGNSVQVNLTGKAPDKSIAAGLLNLATQTLYPDMFLGVTDDHELVLSVKSPGRFPMPIPSQYIQRFSDGLKKGASWCQTVAQEGVEGEKQIDSWTWDGFAMAINNGRLAKQSMTLSMTSVDHGQYCFINIKGLPGQFQGFQVYLPSESVSDIIDQIPLMADAVNATQQGESHQTDVLKSLK